MNGHKCDYFIVIRKIMGSYCCLNVVCTLQLVVVTSTYKQGTGVWRKSAVDPRNSFYFFFLSQLPKKDNYLFHLNSLKMKKKEVSM